MLWMCSGHGVCLTNPGNQNLAGQVALAWLNRYVKNDTQTKLGAPFEYVDQNGAEFTAPTSTRSRHRRRSSPTARARSRWSTAAAPGPAHTTGNAGALGRLALPITPAKATHAVNIPITATEGGLGRGRADA